jgi:phosphosulfolactate synthase (CoM biosynthesis protein A)
MEKCSVCSCDFSLEEEGGISGAFGVLPVDFCPTCFSSMMDMADKLGDDVTLGWGNSRVATKYIYERIHDILNMENKEVVYSYLSEFLDELAHNYEVDTGDKIGAKNESND